MFRFLGLACGIRQEGVLSSDLFAIYIEDIVGKVSFLSVYCCLAVILSFF